jgi:hypothetical protein
MVDAISGAEGPAPVVPSPDGGAVTRPAPALDARRVVVIGGGCYGSYYARQLARAWRAGAARVDDVVVVDRDPDCRVAAALAAGAYGTLPIRLVVDDWDRFLDGWWALGPGPLARDLFVPSPLMPHVCFDWLLARARARWPHRRVGIRSLEGAPPVPWQRSAPDRRHYVSFAEWTCPVNCIEPVRCPHTRGVRDWSLPRTIAAWADGGDGRFAAPAIIFQCVHRTYWVGMIDADAVAAADERIASLGDRGPFAVLVGTVSHCHGALAVLAVD